MGGSHDRASGTPAAATELPPGHDALSDVLEAVRLSGALFFVVRGSPPVDRRSAGDGRARPGHPSASSARRLLSRHRRGHVLVPGRIGRPCAPRCRCGDSGPARRGLCAVERSGVDERPAAEPAPRLVSGNGGRAAASGRRGRQRQRGSAHGRLWLSRLRCLSVQSGPRRAADAPAPAAPARSRARQSGYAREPARGGVGRPAGG